MLSENCVLKMLTTLLAIPIYIHSVRAARMVSAVSHHEHYCLPRTVFFYR